MANPRNRKKSPVRIAFGKILRQRRLDLAFTQEELAERAGIHPTYLGSAERGERNVSIENIVALARALKCSPKDLFPEDPNL